MFHKTLWTNWYNLMHQMVQYMWTIWYTNYCTNWYIYTVPNDTLILYHQVHKLCTTRYIHSRSMYHVVHWTNWYTNVCIKYFSRLSLSTVEIFFEKYRFRPGRGTLSSRNQFNSRFTLIDFDMFWVPYSLSKVCLGYNILDLG